MDNLESRESRIEHSTGVEDRSVIGRIKFPGMRTPISFEIHNQTVNRFRRLIGRAFHRGQLLDIERPDGEVLSMNLRNMSWMRLGSDEPSPDLPDTDQA